MAAIAVLPRLRRDHPDFLRRLDLTHATQRFGQNCAFEHKLGFIGGVLIVAAAASPEVRAARVHSFAGGFMQLDQLRPHQAGLLLERRDRGALSRQDEWRQHDLPIEPCQAVAAVDQLFDRYIEFG